MEGYRVPNTNLIAPFAMYKKPEPTPSLLIDRDEAARLLGVSVSHVKRLEQRGLFPAVKLGASVRYRRGDIEAAINKLAEEGGGLLPPNRT